MADCPSADPSVPQARTQYNQQKSCENHRKARRPRPSTSGPQHVADQKCHQSAVQSLERTKLATRVAKHPICTQNPQIAFLYFSDTRLSLSLSLVYLSLVYLSLVSLSLVYLSSLCLSSLATLQSPQRSSWALRAQSWKRS